MIVGESYGFAITRSQRGCLMSLSAAIDRPHGMDDIFRRKPASGGDHSFASGKTADLCDNALTFLQNGRTARAIFCVIDTAPTEKGRIGRVYDGFGVLFRNVGRSVDLDGFISVQYQAYCEFIQQRILKH